MSECLKHCPFCGGKNVETSYKDTFNGDFRRGVYCADCCGGIYPYYNTEAEAIAAWNSRADYHGYEQAAIEAWENIKAWNARATNGTLTAEQVRKAAKSNSHKYKSPVDDGIWMKEYDWQAIADELNATMGDDGYKQAADYWKGMYEELLTERIGEERDYPEHDGRYECPDCGNVVYYDELYDGGWTIYVEDYQIPFNHCPNCGKKVKR